MTNRALLTSIMAVRSEYTIQLSAILTHALAPHFITKGSVRTKSKDSSHNNEKPTQARRQHIRRPQIGLAKFLPQPSSMSSAPVVKEKFKDYK